MSGNIFNSNGVQVAVVNDGGVFDLDGRKLYDLKGINIYRLSGELVGHLNNGQGAARSLHRQAVPCQREISPNLIAEGAAEMIPIKSAQRKITEMQDLEAMAAKLLETARKLPAGPIRRDILKEIGKFARASTR